MLATAVGIVFLLVFFATLIGKGASAFKQTFLLLDIELNEEVLAPDGELDLTYADFDGLVRAALRKEVTNVSGRSERRELNRLVSIGAGYQVRDFVVQNPELLGTTQPMWVPAASNVDMLVKGNIDASLDESLRQLSNRQIGWVEELRSADRLKSKFNTALPSYLCALLVDTAQSYGLPQESECAGP
jgi:phosphate transport system permease protein